MKKFTFGFYIVAALIIGVELIFAVLFFPSFWQRILAASETAATAAVDLKEKQTALAILSQTDEEKLQVGLGKALAALPEEKKISGLVTGLTTLASQSGIVVKGLEFAPGVISTRSAQLDRQKAAEPELGPGLEEIVIGSGVKAIPVDVSLAGSLEQLADFLKNLTQTSQILGVTAVDYRQSSKAAPETTLSVLIYYQLPKENKINWNQVKPLSGLAIKIVEALPDRDFFLVPPEQH